jgi:hypothetical protein
MGGSSASVSSSPFRVHYVVVEDAREDELGAKRPVRSTQENATPKANMSGEACNRQHDERGNCQLCYEDAI